MRFRMRPVAWGPALPEWCWVASWDAWLLSRCPLALSALSVGAADAVLRRSVRLRVVDEARQAFQEHNASNQSVNQDTLTCASVYGTAQGRREGHPPTTTTGLMLSCRPCLLHPHLFTHSSRGPWRATDHPPAGLCMHLLCSTGSAATGWAASSSGQVQGPPWYGTGLTCTARPGARVKRGHESELRCCGLKQRACNGDVQAAPQPGQALGALVAEPGGPRTASQGAGAGCGRVSCCWRWRRGEGARAGSRCRQGEWCAPVSACAGAEMPEDWLGPVPCASPPHEPEVPLDGRRGPRQQRARERLRLLRGLAHGRRRTAHTRSRPHALSSRPTHAAFPAVRQYGSTSGSTAVRPGAVGAVAGRRREGAGPQERVPAVQELRGVRQEPLRGGRRG